MNSIHDAIAQGGTFRTGSCIVCGRGTDTGLAFVGEAEWAAAGLVKLGLPTNEAINTVAQGVGDENGNVPGGRITVTYRVCGECAVKAGFPVGLITMGGQIPSVQQP